MFQNRYLTSRTWSKWFISEKLYPRDVSMFWLTRPPRTAVPFVLRRPDKDNGTSQRKHIPSTFIPMTHYLWRINMNQKKWKPSRNLETKIISRFKNNSNNQTLNKTYQWRNNHYVIVATSQTFLLLICLPWSALVLPVHFRSYFRFIWPHASQHIPTNLTIFDHLVTDSLVITFSVALLKPLVTSKTVTIVTSLSQLSVSSDADSSSKQCIFNKISDI